MVGDEGETTWLTALMHHGANNSCIQKRAKGSTLVVPFEGSISRAAPSMAIDKGSGSPRQRLGRPCNVNTCEEETRRKRNLHLQGSILSYTIAALQCGVEGKGLNYTT